jgi:microcystin degradation protein MlrC
VVRAATEGDAAALYALLPASHRARESLEAFRARMAADREELRAFGALVRDTRAHRGPRTSVAVTQGPPVAVVEEVGGWALVSAALGAPSGATTADALRALHAALTQRSLGALLEVLSARTRGGLEAELAALADATRNPAALELSTTPFLANVRLPDGRVLVLVKENGQWRVDNLLDRADGP